MDVENQIIKVRVNNFNYDHFKNKGYHFNLNDYIEISAKDLSSGSGTKVNVKCQYCGIVFKKAWRRYLETKNDVCCSDCRRIKVNKTCLDKYGNICSLRNPAILQKSIDKNIKNIGVEFPLCSQDIRRKAFETLKSNKELVNSAFPVSKQQRKIHEIYGGELNYLEFPYCLDIFFENEKIYFEFDGAGHDLSVKFNKNNLHDFKIKEINREKYLKSVGYKEFRIITSSLRMFDRSILIYIKNRAFDILLNQGYNHYYYDIDNEIESFKM